MNERTTKVPKTKSTHKHIQQWISRLEAQARALLDGANIEELSAKERFDVALKIITTMQRFISLDQQIETATPQGGLQVMMTALMRQISAEYTNTADNETTPLVY